MLRAMRHQKRKVIIILVVGAVTLVMSFFGVYQDKGMNISGSAAKVHGTSISMRDFHRALQNAIQNMQQRYGNDQTLTPELLRMLQVRERTLDGLVQQELHAYAARTSGLMVSKKELQSEIIDAPYFQDPQTKAFSRETYTRVLEANGLRPHSYEERLEKDLLSGKLQEAMRTMGQASMDEALWSQRLKETTATLRYALVSADNFPHSVTLSETSVKEFVENKENEPKIKEYYFANIKNYRKEKEVRASHILFRLLPNATANDKSAAKAKAEQALKEINGGLKWEAAVAKYSDEESTKKKGGDLGFFSRGKMVPTFEEAAFSMKKGDVSQAVESKFGFHIIKVTDLKAEESRNLEDPEVQKEIARQLIQKKANEDNFEKARASAWEQIKDLKTLESVLKTQGKGIELKSTAAISLDADAIPGISGDHPKIIDFLAKATVGDKCPELTKVGEAWLFCAVEKLEKPQEKKGDALKELAQRASGEKANHLNQEWMKNIEKSARIVRNAEALRYEE